MENSSRATTVDTDNEEWTKMGQADEGLINLVVAPQDQSNKQSVRQGISQYPSDTLKVNLHPVGSLLLLPIKLQHMKR